MVVRVNYFQILKILSHQCNCSAYSVNVKSLKHSDFQKQLNLQKVIFISNMLNYIVNIK